MCYNHQPLCFLERSHSLVICWERGHFVCHNSWFAPQRLLAAMCSSSRSQCAAYLASLCPELVNGPLLAPVPYPVSLPHPTPTPTTASLHGGQARAASLSVLFLNMMVKLSS